MIFIITGFVSFIFLLMYVAQIDIKLIINTLHTGKFLEYYILFFIVFYITYFTFFDLLATLGKMLFKIKLVTMDYAPVSISESFVRSCITLFSSIVFFLPLLMDILGKLSETRLILRDD